MDTQINYQYKIINLDLKYYNNIYHIANLLTYKFKNFKYLEGWTIVIDDRVAALTIHPKYLQKYLNDVIDYLMTKQN